MIYEITTLTLQTPWAKEFPDAEEFSHWLHSMDIEDGWTWTWSFYRNDKPKLIGYRHIEIQKRLETTHRVVSKED